MERAPRGAFLFLDLDDMRLINKTWGHEAGDRLLKMIGRELRALANGNTVVRFGGDEFVLLLPQASLEEAQALRAAIAARIAEIGARWPVPGGSPGVGATVVASLWGSDPERALRNADLDQALIKMCRDERRRGEAASAHWR